MSIVKIQKKGQVTLPTALRKRGVHRGGNEEYTPAQRSIIDARLAKADADIKAGRVSRPFDTHEEFIADLHRQANKHRAKKSKRSGR